MYRQGEKDTDLLKEGQREEFCRLYGIWDIEKEYLKLLRNKIWCVPKMLAGYPEKLQHILTPPSALFIKGRLPDPDKPAAALIGARNCSPYGEYAAKQLGASLAKRGIQVISGLARGIDSTGQYAAVKAGGSSFGILGCGVDICYPKESEELYELLVKGGEKGGILSELCPGTEPLAAFFPMRNRLISGLADSVIVIEAREKSGTFITVSEALEQGKDVYALPGRINDALSYGCNRLIGQGAFVAYDVEECIRQIEERFYAIRKTKKRSDAYDIMSVKEPDQAEPVQSGQRMSITDPMENCKFMLLDKLDIQFVSLDQLMSEVGEKAEISLLLAALSTLECEGKVESKGNFYRKRME
ncbi:MAG: DNA-processing protein DprA [Lachnospiraceae bacterium]|nr:DNA-processing protein DprA [Lachnospiraceae bacterium]